MDRREELLHKVHAAEELARDSDNMYDTGAKPWMRFELRLIDYGVEYAKGNSGYHIGNYIITANGKWCVNGRYKWYSYGLLDELLDRLGIEYDPIIGGVYDE